MEYLATLGNLLIIAGIPLSLAFWAGHRKGKSDTLKKMVEIAKYNQGQLEIYNCDNPR